MSLLRVLLLLAVLLQYSCDQVSPEPEFDLCCDNVQAVHVTYSDGSNSVFIEVGPEVLQHYHSLFTKNRGKAVWIAACGERRFSRKVDPKEQAGGLAFNFPSMYEAQEFGRSVCREKLDVGTCWMRKYLEKQRKSEGQQ